MLRVKLELVSQAEDLSSCVVRATKALHVPIPGVERAREMRVDASWEEILRWKQSGALVQDALPDLPPEQAEFLLSGATPEEWAVLFPSEEEDA